MLKRLRWLLCVLAAAIVAGCGDTAPTEAPPAPVSQVDLSPGIRGLLLTGFNIASSGIENTCAPLDGSLGSAMVFASVDIERDGDGDNWVARSSAAEGALTLTLHVSAADAPWRRTVTGSLAGSVADIPGLGNRIVVSPSTPAVFSVVADSIGHFLSAIATGDFQFTTIKGVKLSCNEVSWSLAPIPAGFDRR
jgi:hypothetical protein